MKIAWFSPFSNRSAIGKVSKKICEELEKSCEVDIWTHDKDELIETKVNVIHFDANTNASKLDHYNYVIYNMGNFAGNHRDIIEMSQRKSGIVLLHDQTMHSFWGQYYLMPEFAGDNNHGFTAYKDMFREYYGESGEKLAIEAYESGHFPIYDYNNMAEFRLIEPVINNATGVFTHAKFFAQKIKDYFNGPISYSYLPCEVEQLESDEIGFAFDIIRKAKKDGKIVLVSNGIVHPVKHIDRVTNVLQDNKDMANEICYIVIGSNGGDYGQQLEKLAHRELKGCLHMLGYQEDEVMNYALQNADLCINLRYPNSEVCSLSLFEQMTYGKPTLVLDSGIYSEMPDDCVLKIPVEEEEQGIKTILTQLILDRNYYNCSGDNASKFIEENCNVKAYCARFFEFLEMQKVNEQIARLQTRMIDDIGHRLGQMKFSEANLPSTITNLIGNVESLFSENTSKSNAEKVVGVWAGFQYCVPNLKREGISRFMAYMISAMIRNCAVDVEVWSYSFNEQELRDSFSSILGDDAYTKRIKFITEKNWDSYFKASPDKPSYNKTINESYDNLCDIARDYSRADCFIPMIVYLDNVIGTEKPIFVPAHDMAVAEHYYDFITKDPLYKFRYLDINARAENLARNGATIFSNCDTVRQTQILKYIRNVKVEKTAIVYLPVNIPENIENSMMEEDDVRKTFEIDGRYMFYPTQIRPYKNVSTLIKAFNLIKEEYKDLTLVLTGNPSDLPEVEKLIQEFKLASRIKLVASLTENELYSIYKYAAAVPVPSIFEGGFPWQACEALFMQVPLVLTNIPIVKERILYHKMTMENSGLELFNPTNENELAQGLRNVLADREAVVKKQSLFREALLSYDWNIAARRYYELFFHENFAEEAIKNEI